ncbi:unnamed protein product, partial [Closterium sp. Naga37s-1]
MPQGGSPLASRCPILRPPSSSPSLHPLPHPPLRLVLHWKATKGRTIKMAVVASVAKAAGWLVLHWKATKGRTIKMAVVASGAKAAGWFAVGFSPNGGMSGSNAIATDSSGSPVTKDLVGQSSADDAAWTVGSGSISTSGGKVAMKFTKNKGDGASVKVKADNDNNIVWAFGDGDTVSMHNGA